MKEMIEHLDDRVWDSNAPLTEKCSMGEQLNRIRNSNLSEIQINNIIDNVNARLKYWADPGLRRNQRACSPEAHHRKR